MVGDTLIYRQIEASQYKSQKAAPFGGAKIRIKNKIAKGLLEGGMGNSE